MTDNKLTAKPATEKKPESSARGIFIAFLFATLGVASVIITIELSNRGSFPFVTSQRNHLIAAELAVFSIFFVEILGRLANKRLERDALRRGMSARVIIRTAGYLVVGAAVISILASNSALAISVGTITGVVIGFATQNLFSNMLGGIILVVNRVVRAGDEITFMGNTGRVVEIRLIYTVIDSGDNLVFIPNSAMLTNAVQRKKGPEGQ
jgi:small conductance mechanosensitive channel